MKPHSYSDEGIILSRRNFGEADRILSVYTKNHGRISLIAKGTRRPTSRKRGHIEIFNLINFQSVSGHTIDLITEAEVVKDFSLIRKSLKKVSLAYYLAEVVGKITHEQESNTLLFDLLLDSFDTLNVTKKLSSLRLEFIYKILTILGYWPEGVELSNPDEELEKVIERQLYSKRVGKRMIQ